MKLVAGERPDLIVRIPTQTRLLHTAISPCRRHVHCLPRITRRWRVIPGLWEQCRLYFIAVTSAIQFDPTLGCPRSTPHTKLQISSLCSNSGLRLVRTMVTPVADASSEPPTMRLDIYRARAPLLLSFFPD